MNDPFVEQFVNGIEDLFTPFRKTLTASNCDGLIHIVIKYLAGKLESEIFKKRFNQLGGLQVRK